MIKTGSVVSFEYTLSDDDGNIIETNVGESAVTYTQGEHQIIPGLENAMIGMGLNEERQIRIEPQDAYGPVNPEYFKEVPKGDMPSTGLTVGTMLQARGPRGEDFSVRVHEIREETVVLDLNHPLAGKILNLDVKVLNIDPGDSR